MARISIEDFPLYEQHNPVNTPRSIRACAMEEIAPEDLLFVPLKHSKDKLTDSANEYEFRVREEKRLKLIKAIRHRKKLTLKEALKSRIKSSAPPRTQCLTARAAGNGFDTLEEEMEGRKVDFHRSQRIDREKSEAQRKRAAKETSAKFRENTLEQIERERKREEDERRRERELRKKFHKKMLLDIETEEERARNKRYYDEIKQKLVDEKSRKAKAVYDMANQIAETRRKRIERKIKIFNEKTLRFETIGKKELMEDKAEALRSYRERSEQILDNAKRRAASREESLLDHYEEVNRRAEENAMRSVGNRMRCSNGFRDTTESRRLARERKAKSMKKVKRDLSKKLNDAYKRSSNLLTDRVIKDEEIKKYEPEVKRRMNLSGKKPAGVNMERLKELEGTSGLRAEIEEKNRKITEFLKKREQELKLKNQKKSTTDRKKEKEAELLHYMAIWNSWDANKSGKSEKPVKFDPKRLDNKFNRHFIASTQQKEIPSTNESRRTWTKWDILIGGPSGLTM
eukprot:TRINITY_DN1636_c0_g2_i5.p1 TRINITY_DN1636_c0_g2~~TRINITY_DN1636_c0_g2_i5.p1  ORF type:complete len:514 (+),score=149.81 TRINITY_DN1636_c0_g2_i5:80-1621(+)